ncbi:MAG: hypothetical protein CM15mP108_2660 [Gammaproteobacteria bacterium]|nr:MAG: hypothetical protein CM15mP108_2660 [Gammaproteobacteria bacterium]
MTLQLQIFQNIWSKRTSTYKFFQTPESIKAALAAKYFSELKDEFSQNTSNINSSELSVIVLRSVEIIYNYFIQKMRLRI